MKPVRFFCPHCAQPMRAPSEVRGRNVACPRCQEPIKVPLPQTFSPPPEPETRVISLRRPPRPRSRVAKWWPLLLPFACVAAIASFAHFYMRQDQQADLNPQPIAVAANGREALDDRDGNEFQLVQRNQKLMAGVQQAGGIGVDRESVINRLSEQYGCEFHEMVTGDESVLFKTSIAGVSVMLWGPAEELSAVAIVGTFEGGFGTVTGMVLGAVLAVITPDWPLEQRADWFIAASGVSGNSDVSTIQQGVKVNVASAIIGGDVIRVITFTNAESN